MFLKVVDKNNQTLCLNSDKILRFVDTRDGVMIVMPDNFVVYTKESFLSVTNRLNAN